MFMSKRILVGLVILVALGGTVGLVGQSDEITFKFAMPWAPMTLDPARNIGIPMDTPVYNTYDPLMMPVKGGEPIPWVAESYTHSEDGLTYTFKIRKGIKFHDETELTAEDVAFSMDRMLVSGEGYSFLWAGILEPGDTEVVNKYTVTFHLRETFGPFVPTLVQFNIVNKNLCMKEKKPGDFGEFGDYCQEYLSTHDAGSGPYKLESIELGAEYTLTKFDDYWKGWRENQIDRVTVEVIPEEATRVMMFEKGEIGLSGPGEVLPASTYEELAKIPGIEIDDQPDLRLIVIQMNNTKPPFDDINVRKAVSYALDYDTIINDVYRGGVQAQGPVPILMPGHADDVFVYHQDFGKAREFLSKSKYSMEELQEMELEYCYITGMEVQRLVGLVLINSLEPLGLNVKLRAEPWARIVAMSTAPETTSHFHAIYVGSKYPSPDSHTYGVFHPNSWGSYASCSWYENPTVTELLNKARSTVDIEERYELYRETQRIIVEDAGALFLLNPPHRVAIWNWVKGYNFLGLLSFDLKFYTLTIER